MNVSKGDKGVRTMWKYKSMFSRHFWFQELTIYDKKTLQIQPVMYGGKTKVAAVHCQTSRRQ